LEIFKELEGPQLLRNSRIITKEKLDKELVVVNTLWAEEFDNLIEFPKDEIKCCFFTFVNDNEDHMSLIDQIHSEFKGIEEDILSLRVKKDITIQLMKEFIEEWLNTLLKQIIHSE
jgi:hypothetical protein